MIDCDYTGDGATAGAKVTANFELLAKEKINTI